LKSYYPIKVKLLDQYKLLITFDNKERRVFDAEPYLSDNFFAPLRNPSIFNSVTISPISLEWAGGIDMCPDELYYNSTPYITSGAITS
jgi:hypothetical protein